MNTTHEIPEEENPEFMASLHATIARAAYDHIHEVIPAGGNVPVSAIMAAASWLLVDMMLVAEVEFDERFLTSLRQTYEAVKFVNAQAPDKESVH